MGEAGNSNGSDGGNASVGNAGESNAASNGLGNNADTAQATESNESNETNETNETNEVVNEKPDYRKTFRERFGEGIEGWDSEDNDMFYQEANKQFDELNEYKKKNQEINDRMIKSLNAVPELAGAVRDVMQGASLEEALARNIDIDSIIPVEGDPDREKWDKGLKDREARQKESEAYQAEIAKNQEASVQEMIAFAQEQNLDDKAAEAFFNEIDDMVSNLTKQKVTKEILSNFYRAMNADNEIAEATEKVKVDTLNQKIEAVKEKDNNKKTGDGLPKVDASNLEQDSGPKIKNAWLDAIDEQEEKRKKINY